MFIFSAWNKFRSARSFRALLVSFDIIFFSSYNYIILIFRWGRTPIDDAKTFGFESACNAMVEWLQRMERISEEDHSNDSLPNGHSSLLPLSSLATRDASPYRPDFPNTPKPISSLTSPSSSMSTLSLAASPTPGAGPNNGGTTSDSNASSPSAPSSPTPNQWVKWLFYQIFVHFYIVS